MLDLKESVRIILTPEFENFKYTNTPGDYGGATKGGVEQRNYDYYRSNRGLEKQSVEHITLEEVEEVYDTYFWTRAGCDKVLISGKDRLAFVHFNTAVQRGPVKATEMLQEIIGIDVSNITGFYGEMTTKLVNVCDENVLILKYLNFLKEYFTNHVKDKSSQLKFLKGWLNRLNFVAKIVQVAFVIDVNLECNKFK